MSWFNGNKRLRQEHELAENNSGIEIVAHKKATKDEVNQVKKANAQLNKIFAKNHFTLTIYLASGGVIPEKLTTKEKGETPKNWKRTR